MRSLRLAIVLTLAALLAAPGAAAGQEAEGLPKGPMPYAKIRPPTPKKRAATPAKPAETTPAPKSEASAQTTTPAPKAPAAPAATAPAQQAAAPAPAPAAPPPVALPPAPAVRGARLGPGQPIPPTELQAFLDGWMADAMDRTHVAGAAVSVVQNGQVILNKGYGFADDRTRRLVDPNRTLFRIGSISKTFTWILLMKEVEAGRIRLDRPINLYLPEKVRVRGDGMARDVLVRNLLDHSGGFEDRALGQLFESDPRSVRPLDLYLRQERPRRVREPGVLSSYSNYGAALAGEAAVFVSGKTFERRVEEEITGPLGMAHTTFREPRDERRGLPAPMPAALRADIATGYRWNGTRFDRRAYEYIGQIAPAGAGSSTGGDMSRYMLALLGDGAWNGATIFGPGVARAFRTPLQQTPPGLNGWAHGFMIYTLPGGYRGYGHGGDTISFHSNMVLIPQLNLGVFVTTNSDSGTPLVVDLPDRLVRHFYAEPTPFPRGGSPDLGRYAAAYKGDYLSTRRTYSGLEGFVMLFVSGVSVKVTPDGRLITKSQDAAQAWTPEGDPGEGRFIATKGDARLAFRMRDGRATSFRGGANAATLQRAPFLKRASTIEITGGLAAAAAIATLVGLVVRNRRDFRENPMQGRAALVQNIQAGLWLASLGLFALWGSQIADLAKVMYGWPSPLVVSASACALVAVSLNLLTLLALPAVWQGGRRVDSWPVLRKLFFTTTVLVYAAFSIVLFMDGALQPWSG